MKPIMFDIQIFALVMLLIVILTWLFIMIGMITELSYKTHVMLNVMFYIPVIYMIVLDLDIMLPTSIDIRTLTFYYG